MEMFFHQKAGTVDSDGQVDPGAEIMFMAGLYSGALNAGTGNTP
jgi:hypothetical protein